MKKTQPSKRERKIPGSKAESGYGSVQHELTLVHAHLALSVNQGYQAGTLISTFLLSIVHIFFNVADCLGQKEAWEFNYKVVL